MAFIEPMHRNKPNITYLLIPLRVILQKIPKPSVTEISLKITYLKFGSNLWGANELKRSKLYY